MELQEIAQLYAGTKEVSALGRMVRDPKLKIFFLDGAKASSAAVLFAGLARSEQAERHILVFVLDDEEAAGYFYHDLVQLSASDENILFFPSSFRRAVKYGQRDSANEILRTEVLGRISSSQASSSPLYLVTYPDAIVEKVTSKETLNEHLLHLQTGEAHNLTQLEQRLQELGFRRRDYVYEPGEYAVRGSILDIYSYTYEQPFRIDFFGDDIESIRTFEVETQLSGKKLDSINVIPDMGGQTSGKRNMAQLLPKETIWVFHDYQLAIDRAKIISEQGFTAQAGLDAGEEANALKASEWLTPAHEIEKEWSAFRRIETGSHCSTDAPDAVCRIDIEPQPLFHKNFDLVRSSFRQYLDNGLQLYILSDSAKQQERLRDIFEETNDRFPFISVSKTLHEGFIDRRRKGCFFTDHQIFDRFYKYNLRSDRARSGKVALSLKELLQFEPGDYVVHIDHGIGKFAGLVRMPSADGSTQEMMKLTYRNDDVVLVSIHSLHKVSKYKGKEGEPPTLSHLGTGAWEKMKDRTKKKIKDIARDLIKLYSKRLQEKGFSFSHDSFLQHELEASFLYEDTPDQLRVTQEVKADMERDRPMDRLVCGDVGFGKTEIAVRAAFKAACDNKQVAVMVPTTVLALQHFKTFQKRLKNFPVRVDYLSRARSSADTRQVLKDLQEGKINIIIGTHKLIGKQVKFNDLGLLIIDEEQKFGVAVKEKLRQLKANIDTLTMSATPIPRTLQFSLMGARDFSVIQTPPPNRRPIQTEIHTFGHEIIAEAINFEMSRNGQTYIVSPRISSLPHIANLIHQYVPDARVAIGHGQMPPAELEKIIIGFVNYDYDVLVCTTIVENGVDIPNANTILIDGAQHFGLSDLHQMRGRVGRSDKKAFCYLLAPPLAQLNEESRRRLQALENFSDLGSGIHIAMQDLDIRGAGNLLGAEQSGFIVDLGYETYRKILSEAVNELKNDEFADLYADELKANALNGEMFVDESSVECDLKAFLPETYVPGSGERMMLYRELDSMSTDEQVEAFGKRLVDRFGPIPPAGEELLRIVKLRRLARQLGIERISLKNKRMTLYFVSRNDSPYYQSKTFEKIIGYAMSHVRECALGEQNGKRRMRINSVGSVSRAIEILENIMSQPLPKD